MRRNGRGSRRSDELWRRRGAFARRPSGRPSTARTSSTGSAAACPPSPAKVCPPPSTPCARVRTSAHRAHRCSTVHSQASAHTPSRSACPTALVSPAGSACLTPSEYAHHRKTVLYLFVYLFIYLYFDCVATEHLRLCGRQRTCWSRAGLVPPRALSSPQQHNISFMN